MKCDKLQRVIDAEKDCCTSYWPAADGWRKSSVDALRKHEDGSRPAAALAQRVDDWVRKELVPRFRPRALLVVLGRVHALGINASCVLSTGIPQAHLDQLLRDDGRLESPALFRWFDTKRPFAAERYAFVGMSPSPTWMATCDEFGVDQIVIDGVVNFETNQALIVKLYDPAGEQDGKQVAANLHDFLRAQAVLEAPAPPRKTERSDGPTPGSLYDRLTAKEVEILRWLQLGKTNIEIGMILNNSPATVKTHVQRMLSKVGAGMLISIPNAANLGEIFQSVVRPPLAQIYSIATSV